MNKDVLNRKQIGLADIIICVVLFVACCLPLIFTLASAKSGELVRIKYEGQVYEYDLSSNNDISLKDGKIRIIISNGQVVVGESDCEGQVCTHNRPISKAGECVVCLPNGLVVEIIGDEFDLSTGG